jgi:hypothetical protein
MHRPPRHRGSIDTGSHFGGMKRWGRCSRRGGRNRGSQYGGRHNGRGWRGAESGGGESGHSGESWGCSENGRSRRIGRSRRLQLFFFLIKGLFASQTLQKKSYLFWFHNPVSLVSFTDVFKGVAPLATWIWPCDPLVVGSLDLRAIYDAVEPPIWCQVKFPSRICRPVS